MLFPELLTCRFKQFLMAAAISALAGCIAVGSSVAGTTLQAVVGGIDYNVACGVEVANWTKYMLEDPCVSVNGGLIRNPPVYVLPGEKELMVSIQQASNVVNIHQHIMRIKAAKASEPDQEIPQSKITDPQPAQRGRAT